MSPGALAKKSPTDPSAAASPARTPLILVVEDDADVRTLAGTVLREAGYRVLEAETGHHAMMLFEGHPDIDLIFTDVVMPGIDGFKLADMTKFKRPDVRILYATAFMDLARDRLGVVHGQILKKPYHADQLEQLVKEALG